MDRLRAVFWNDEQDRVRALWRLLLHTVALGLFGSIAIVLLSSVVPGSGGSSFPSVVVALSSAAVVAGATWLLAARVDKRRFDEFGLRLSARWWADFGAGVVIGVVLMTGIFVVELRAGWLSIEDRLVGAAPGQPFALALLGPFVVFVAVGFYEELFSRGYHLRNMAEGLRVGPIGPRAALLLATLISSSVFGLLHASNPSASLISTVSVALAGCMLALGLLWTRELGLPIGLHLSWNFCQGNVFGFPVSGNFAGARVVAIEQLGDPLITGGSFGPEAGIIGIAAMLIGAGLIALWVLVSRGELRLGPL